MEIEIPKPKFYLDYNNHGYLIGTLTPIVIFFKCPPIFFSYSYAWNSADIEGNQWSGDATDQYCMKKKTGVTVK